VILADGSRGRMHRSVVLGAVSDIPTRREARTLLEQRLRPLNQGTQRPQSTVRFKDFVESEWKTLVLPTLKLSTQHGYQVMLRNHVLPYFGDGRLCDIAKQDVQQFVTEKFRQKLAWQTVRNAWIVLSTVLDSAVEYEYLTVNSARGVKFPQQAPRPEPKVLTASDLKRLLAQLEEPYRTMVALSALTGVRIGELLALRWRAVDLRAGTLRIAESVFLGEFQLPKSEKSVRTIPIGPVAREIVEEHYRHSARRSPEDLVFPRAGDKPYRVSNLLEQVLQPAAIAAGLGHVTWHQLRHVHATVLHDLGVPVKIAQKQLGHATVETTLNIYTHAIPETHRRAVEDLERVLFPNVPKLGDGAKGAKCVIQ
jgi:integrase